MRGVFDKAVVIAERQHGRIAWSQLIDIGVDRGRVQRWSDDGRLHRIHKGVYRRPGIGIHRVQRLDAYDVFELDVARRRRSEHLAFTYGDVFERARQTAAEMRRALAQRSGQAGESHTTPSGGSVTSAEHG